LGFSTHEGRIMEDTRCCGTGTCIINAQGYCWCGQRWDGTRMCFPERAETDRQEAEEKLQQSADDGKAQG
jgi:hypothetical protein